MEAINTVDQETAMDKLTTLRETYIEFVTKINAIEGSSPHKSNAFTRFEEGHMWMQNAILAYHLPKTTQESAND